MQQHDSLEQVDFGIIRYANCWEDADTLLTGLNPVPNARILSVGSAGDNSFSLLTAKPDVLMAVDVSAVQLYLMELKKACFLTLDHSGFLSFLGFADSTSRDQVYTAHLKKHLSPDARRYWDANRSAINAGVIYSGKFEKYFLFFSRFVLPVIHSRRCIEELFESKSAGHQQTFYATVWNNRRWQWLFKIFFSQSVLGRFGRDPRFLKEVQTSVADFIYDKAAVHLSSVECQRNYFLRFILTGKFGNDLPHYAREENFELIRNHVNRMQLRKGFAQDALDGATRFDCMNLSNIFEYMDEETFVATSRALIAGLTNGGKMAYWNLMVPRDICSKSNEVAKVKTNSTAFADKGFFYHRFYVDGKATA